jgi:predicted methyltransferase
MTKTPTLFTDEGEEIVLPFRWEVCDYCEGRGTSSAYLGSFTSSEMWEMGEDFCEDYMRGNYDKPCPECDGRTTVAVVDEERCPADLLAQWREWERDEAESRYVQAMERRMGA